MWTKECSLFWNFTLIQSGLRSLWFTGKWPIEIIQRDYTWRLRSLAGTDFTCRYRKQVRTVHSMYSKHVRRIFGDSVSKIVPSFLLGATVLIGTEKNEAVGLSSLRGKTSRLWPFGYSRVYSLIDWQSDSLHPSIFFSIQTLHQCSIAKYYMAQKFCGYWMLDSGC